MPMAPAQSTSPERHRKSGGQQQDKQIAGDKDCASELPKVWGIKDPFVYAPPKPDRDPWLILLEPLLEKDKMQCDAWKDEVQNLLIFAGLFSAVVTAFIIESYKTLQPGPNDTIVSLLSVIATRLDNTTDATSAHPHLASSSFSPAMSSIRVNSFWFISLVLSLATVLFGIISLQWIREHQSYPNLSPKETYALFQMRADGLEKWHVPKVFTALPLLLQIALVLFLSGIIDFLLSFGDIVVIPVSIVIVLILLFLVATTLLPTIQAFLLRIPYPYTRTSKCPPSQCPYKSPQAHAFRTILCSIIRLYLELFTNRHKLESEGDHFTAYLRTAWAQQTWTLFDSAWLRLRDAYMRRSYHRTTKKYYIERDRLGEPFPIFDLVQGLLESVHSRDIDLIENCVAVQYHCFTEISNSITSFTPEPTETDDTRVQFNAYFQDLMNRNDVNISVALSDFFNLNAWVDVQGEAFMTTFQHEDNTAELLHHENISLFLAHLGTKSLFNNPRLYAHRRELTTRLSRHFHMERYELRPAAVELSWPDCLANYSPSATYFQDQGDSDLFFWQWGNTFLSLFQAAARDDPPSGRTLYTHRGLSQSNQYLDDPSLFQAAAHEARPPCTAGRTWYTHRGLTQYMDEPSRISLHALITYLGRTDTVGAAIRRQFSAILDFLTEKLEEQLSSQDFREPKLLFYITALYICAIGHPFPSSMNRLLSTMRKYKARTIDVGITNNDLEETLGRDSDGRYSAYDRFSQNWWYYLLEVRISTEDVTPPSSSKSDVSSQESTAPPSNEQDSQHLNEFTSNDPPT